MAAQRWEILQAVAEAMSAGARQFRCCQILGLCERRLMRWRQEADDRRLGGYRAHGQRLCAAEVEEATALIQKARKAPQSLRAAYAEQLDRGIHVASAATLYRLRKALRPVDSRAPSCPKVRRRTPLTAQKVNVIWCWDITPMRLRVGSGWCYFYAFLDLFSRKVMAYTVEVREDGILARDVLADALQRWTLDPATLTLHSDNGSPMKHEKLVEMLRQLQVRITRSRPHVSDDNAFIESLFATFKTRSGYPEAFGNLEEARAFCAQFVAWYNTAHRHSRLDWLTPEEVYTGKAESIQAHRNRVLEEARKTHPSRFGSRRKTFSAPLPVTLRWAIPKG